MVTPADRQAILDLRHGQSVIVGNGNSDCGDAQVWLINDVYLLFSIPMFGGQPQYFDDYAWHRIDEMIEKIDSWC